MSNKLKTTKLVCQQGQTYCLGDDIRLSVKTIYKTDDGRRFTQFLVEAPKQLEIVEEKEDLGEEEVVQLKDVADLLKIIKNALSGSRLEEDQSESASDHLSKILTVKRKRKMNVANVESCLAQGCSGEGK